MPSDTFLSPTSDAIYRELIREREEALEQEREEDRRLREVVGIRQRKEIKAGRQKGSLNASTVLKQQIRERSENILFEHLPAIMRKAVDMAKEGDTSMIKLVFDKALPSLKAVEHNSEEKAKTGITINISQMEITPKKKNEKVIEGEQVDG